MEFGVRWCCVRSSDDDCVGITWKRSEGNMENVPGLVKCVSQLVDDGRESSRNGPTGGFGRGTNARSLFGPNVNKDQTKTIENTTQITIFCRNYNNTPIQRRNTYHTHTTQQTTNKFQPVSVARPATGLPEKDFVWIYLHHEHVWGSRHSNPWQDGVVRCISGFAFARQFSQRSRWQQAWSFAGSRCLCQAVNFASANHTHSGEEQGDPRCGVDVVATSIAVVCGTVIRCTISRGIPIGIPKRPTHADGADGQDVANGSSTNGVPITTPWLHVSSQTQSLLLLIGCHGLPTQQQGRPPHPVP